jgi:Fur family transcriptional regulator, ferric uptake regulator
MSSDDTSKFKQMLSNGGYRLTDARIDTFKLLMGSEPQSISQILARAKGKIDRVSVYRSIELFEKLGISHRVYIGWKYKIELSDDFVAHHHHLSCLGCGKIIDIEDEEHMNSFIKEVTLKFNFKPRRHQFEIDGYCAECYH